jgi:hypothetical protein
MRPVLLDRGERQHRNDAAHVGGTHLGARRFAPETAPQHRRSLGGAGNTGKGEPLALTDAAPRLPAFTPCTAALA